MSKRCKRNGRNGKRRGEIGMRRAKMEREIENIGKKQEEMKEDIRKIHFDIRKSRYQNDVEFAFESSRRKAPNTLLDAKRDFEKAQREVSEMKIGKSFENLEKKKFILKGCCEDMVKAYETGVVKLAKMDHWQFSSSFFVIETGTKKACILFCPFCGTKLNLDLWYYKKRRCGK